MKKHTTDGDVYILAIESSCDETAASVVKNGRQVLSNVISSQIELHTLYGGVVPEIASRKHIEKINQVIEQALEDAGMTLAEITAIAGGVASNSALREGMAKACRKEGLKFYHPSPIYCTDNAAMIGVAAYYEYIGGARAGWDLNAVPNLKLGER